MKKNVFLLALTLVSAVVFGQIPSGYYNSVTPGAEGDDLRDELRSIISSGHSQNSYDDLHDYYESTDNFGSNKVWDMYSMDGDGNAAYYFYFNSGQTCGSYSDEGDCYNREHSVPQTWFNSAQPMYADLFIVVPTDGYVNGQRSNFPFGEVSSASWTSSNGSKKGSCSYPGYSGTVFEPIDDYKGDFARAYFYVATRYMNQVSSWSGANFDGNNLSTWTINMMLEWNELDPISQKEIDRNNAVYDIQGNRNPYIDHPEWINCVFGSGCLGIQFTSTPVTEAQEDAAYTYNVTYEVEDETETITATTLPAWLTFMPNTANNSATLTGTPSTNDVGTHDVVLTLSENGGDVTQSFTIEVLSLSAPITIFEKNFDDSDLYSGGWTEYSVTGDAVWDIADYYTSAPHSGYITGYDGSQFENEDWLISPAYDADNYNDEVLSFQSALNYATAIFPEVKYSTDYSGTGDPNSATWTDLSPTLPAGDSWDFISSGNMDISGITGSAVYFAFVYNSTTSEASTWEIDDIILEGTVIQSIANIEKENIKLYPNPAKDNIVLEYTLENASNVEISIFDILGSKIQTVSDEFSQEGKNTHAIDLQIYNSGIYFMNIKTDNTNTVVKFIVQ